MTMLSVMNVNQGLAEGLRHLISQGMRQDSRNGPVLVSPGPVMTMYKDPTARVLFSPLRDANPFFHFMEALWMLAGRNDLAWVRMFNSNIKNYSDDATTLHGAYGHRWRHWGYQGQYHPEPGMDQFPALLKELRKPLNRRAVLTMWNPEIDLGQDSLDIPCNDIVFFSNHTGALDMTVCCRSNDIWWGCYGSNMVHFSMLMEYIAGSVGLPIGNYYQLSNNFHLYTDVVPLKPDLPEDRWGNSRARQEAERWYLVEDALHADLYTTPAPRSELRQFIRVVNPNAPTRLPMFTKNPHNADEVDRSIFDACLYAFMEDAAEDRQQDIPFFREVARPMFRAWACYKTGLIWEAEEHASQIKSGDWAIACTEWLDRRKQTKLERAATKEKS